MSIGPSPPPRRAPASVPATSPLCVGAPYCGPPLPSGDAVDYTYLPSGHQLRVVLTHLSDHEIASIGESGRVDIALAVQPLVFSLVAYLDGVISWSGAPYSWHAQTPRPLPPLLPPRSALTLTLVLIERSDATVQAVRPLRLSISFSQALHSALLAQIDQPFDHPAYDQQVAHLHRLWLDGTLVDLALAHWSSRRSSTWRGATKPLADHQPGADP